MNTWILDTAIARLLSTNAVVLTEQPNSQMVDKPYLGIISGLPVVWPLGLAFVSTRFVMGWGCRQDGTKVLAQFSLRQTSRLGHEVILFRDTCRPAGRNSVVLDGAFIVANHFEQMGANRVETIVTTKPSVGIERP